MRILTAFCLTFLFSISLFAEDWSAIRGDNGTGSIAPGGMLSTGKPIKLEVAWKKKIGSGYSSVVLAGENVIVMYSESEKDVIACLNNRSGETVWKKPIGNKFVGANGSFDGPLSTPAIKNETVFALSAVGRLISFNLKDGSENWSRDLQEVDKAKLPMYGFTTSPIVFEDSLIVQIGAPEKSLAAFDCATGELKWTALNDSVSSQTPCLIEMEGQPLLLVAGGKNLAGVNPVSGEVVFEFEHGGENGSAVMPVVFDSNNVLITVDDRFSKAVSLRAVEDAINVSEEWQQPTIKNTYNIPAICGEDAYAYSTRILTSVDTKTGKANWKSRKPGDGFLIVVDGHMIINTKQGGLHVAKASSGKYEEVAKLELFEDLVWSIPAYSNNSIYLRSLGEVARVDIVTAADSSIAAAEKSMPLAPVFKNFVDSVEAAGAEEQGKLVKNFLEAQRTLPVIENDFVHFVYRGPGEDVAVASDIFGARQERKMKRLGGTDFFYYASQQPDDQRANYVFLVDYKLQLDSLNSDRVITSSVYAGEMEFAARLRGEDPLKMNWFAMNGWKEPPFLKAAKADVPELKTVELESEDEKRPVKYEVLLPPGYDDKMEARFPVVYVMPGSQANKFGGFAQIASDIFKHQGSEGYAKVDPAIIVFTDNLGPEFSNAIVPSVDSEYRTIASREGRSIVSSGFIASQGLSNAFDNADMFSAVSLQSPLIFGGAKDAIEKSLDGLEQPVRVYLEWGRYDMFNPHENWDSRKQGKELYDLLSKNDKIELAGGQVNDSTDWSSWRNRFDRVLQHLISRE